MKSSALPVLLADRADANGYWLPDPPCDGWSWVSLHDPLSLDELDRLAVDAAAAGGGASVAFSVHDEDSVYLATAETGRVAARLVLNRREFDAQQLGAKAKDFGSSGPRDFVAWSQTHAPRPAIEADVKRIIRSADVEALLATVGLYPEPRPRQPWEPWDWWSPPEGDDGISDRTWTEQLTYMREYAVLHEPEGRFDGPRAPGSS